MLNEDAGGLVLLADGELSQGSFHRSKERIQPFIYNTSLTPEQNIQNGNQHPALSWLAGWLRGFGVGIESLDYQRPDQLAAQSRLLNHVKLRDIWMDVALSEKGDYDREVDQDVKELISVNYIKVRACICLNLANFSFVRLLTLSDLYL